MTRKDRAAAVALAAIAVWTASGLYIVDQKAKEYEDSMIRPIVVETETEIITEAEVEPVTADSIPGGVIEEEIEPAPVEAVAETEPQDLGTFKLTAYCACPKCCGEWSDGITYTGTTATQGRTVAVDPSVIPLGSTVNINGRAYIAEDIGGAIDGNRIDVFFSSHADALEFGVQYSTVTIEI